MTTPDPIFEALKAEKKAYRVLERAEDTELADSDVVVEARKAWRTAFMQLAKMTPTTSQGAAAVLRIVADRIDPEGYRGVEDVIRNVACALESGKLTGA